jgi:hypothetical protein
MAEERVAHRDDNEFIVALDRAMTGGVFPMEQWIGRSIHPDVRLVGPYTRYRLALMEALREMESVEAVSVPAGVAVVVTPSRLDSPDFTKIVVRRDGVAIPPIADELQPVTLSNSFGVRAHSTKVASNFRVLRSRQAQRLR